MARKKSASTKIENFTDNGIDPELVTALLAGLQGSFNRTILHTCDPSQDSYKPKFWIRDYYKVGEKRINAATNWLLMNELAYENGNNPIAKIADWLEAIHAVKGQVSGDE